MLTIGSFVERVCDPTIVTAVRGGHVARVALSADVLAGLAAHGLDPVRRAIAKEQLAATPYGGR